ncbi:MAG: TIGR00730 family Rossman fold protein [Proteiniphilum sp.]|nr:TIGR00730 family Rossman fold protein [Proteiniphilum sp.]
MIEQYSSSKIENISSSDVDSISKVVVYCASSPHIDSVYFETAKDLGRLLALNDISCISGAGKQGLMGAINNSVLQHGGKVIGVIPQFMVDQDWFHPGLTEMIITQSMHERKQKMAQLSHAAIALPGGIGTLEELAEILTWRQLGLYNKPVIILNINGYYDPLFAMLDQMIKQNFMHDSYKNMWQVVTSPEGVINCLQNNELWTTTITKYDKKEL